MTSECRIPRFDPTKMEARRTCLIIGPRNSGKSTLMAAILQNTQHLYHWCLAMTKTRATVDFFKQIMPPSFIWTGGYDYDTGKKYVDFTHKLAETGKNRNSLLIMDDCMADKKCMKGEEQTDLALNGRHSNTALMVATQYVVYVPSDIRGNIDYIFACGNTSRVERKKIYDFWFSCFNTYAEFSKVFDECTKNFGVMVMDRTTHDLSITGSVRFYRAPEKVAPFKMCSQVFWKLDEEFERRKREISVDDPDILKVR
jgi:hypothetical protein